MRNRQVPKDEEDGDSFSEIARRLLERRARGWRKFLAWLWEEDPYPGDEPKEKS